MEGIINKNVLMMRCEFQNVQRKFFHIWRERIWVCASAMSGWHIRAREAEILKKAWDSGLFGVIDINRQKGMVK